MNDPLAHARSLFFEELIAIKQEFSIGVSDKTKLLETVHRLKGGSGFLGFTVLEERAKALDSALKKGEPFDSLLLALLEELSNLLRGREG